jgi:hypothetical protein
MINFSSSCRAKKSMINDVLKYSSSTALRYLYNTYKRQDYKPFSKWFFYKKFMKWFTPSINKKFKGSVKWFFFQKNCGVICIINFKNTLFKGFTREDPWIPSLVKQI